MSLEKDQANKWDILKRLLLYIVQELKIFALGIFRTDG